MKNTRRLHERPSKQRFITDPHDDYLHTEIVAPIAIKPKPEGRTLDKFLDPSHRLWTGHRTHTNNPLASKSLGDALVDKYINKSPSLDEIKKILRSQ